MLLARMTDLDVNLSTSLSYFAKNEDAASALELKKALVQYDRTLLVADPRRMEPKKVRRARYRTRRGLADLRITLYSSEEREHALDDRKVTDRAQKRSGWLSVRSGKRDGTWGCCGEGNGRFSQCTRYSGSNSGFRDSLYIRMIRVLAQGVQEALETIAVCSSVLWMSVESDIVCRDVQKVGYEKRLKHARKQRVGRARAEVNRL